MMTTIQPTPTAPPGSIPEGVYIQPYREAIHGDVRAAIERMCDDARALGCPGLAWHGFPQELLAAWDGLARTTAARSLLALAAWGLDGKNASAARKGDLVGQLLAKPTCAAGLLDAEGQYDHDDGPADDMDEAGAIALGTALRARAPMALVGDQPWYAMRSHANVRRTAKPIELGGTLAGFPVEEFGLVCNLGRFRQGYIYRKQGLNYRPTYERMDRDWTAIAPALRAVGVERPLGVTVQGYGWLLHELVDVLIERGVRPGMPVFMWAEPWPDAVALRALRALQWLRREGFVREGRSALDAVRDAQTELNRQGARLDVDGAFGDASYAAAGLT